MTKPRKDQNSEPHKDESKVKITQDSKLASTVQADPKLESFHTLEKKEEEQHKSKEE